MEKLPSHISFAALKTLPRRLAVESTSSNFLWRVVLGALFSGAMAISFFSWLLYGEVTSEPSVPIVPKRTPVPLSLDELRGVISFYQQKEENFRSLRSSLPTPPSLDTESGMSVIPTLDQASEQLLVQ